MDRLLGLGEAALSASLGGAKQGERLRAPLCSIVLASLVDWLVAQAAAALCVLEAATLCARGSSHVCAKGCSPMCVCASGCNSTC